MTAGVEYIARVRCACGATAETAVRIYRTWRGLYRCEPELEHDMPNGWLGGYDRAHPPQCPACVQKEYGP